MNYNLIRELKRITALVLIVCLLPFADYQAALGAETKNGVGYTQENESGNGQQTKESPDTAAAVETSVSGSQTAQPQQQAGTESEEATGEAASGRETDFSDETPESGAAESENPAEEAGLEEGVLEQPTAEERIYADLDIQYLKHIRKEQEGNLVITQDYTLTEDMETDCLYIGNGVLDLNGYTLTVHHDILQEGGTLAVGSGSLTVEGQYLIAKVTAETEKPAGTQADTGQNDTAEWEAVSGRKNVSGDVCYSLETCTGIFSMEEGKGSVTVEGTFWYDSEIPKTTAGAAKEPLEGAAEGGAQDEAQNPYALKKGTLNLNGHVCIKNKVFDTNTVKVYLGGGALQLLDIAAGNDFGSLYVENESEEGIYSERILNYESISCWKKKIEYRDFTVITGDTKLTEDMVVEGNLLVLSGGTAIDLNGHTLTVRGDLIQQTGFLNVCRGRLMVEGDYRLQKIRQGEDGYSYQKADACLVMKYGEDYALVEGDLYYDGAAYFGNLSAGTLELKGDFLCNSLKEGGYFYSTNEHKTVFSGEEKQRLGWLVDDRDSYGNCRYISNLTIANTSEEGVVFSGTPALSGTVRILNGQDLVGDIALYGTVSFGQARVKGNVKNLGNSVYLYGTLRVDGNIGLDNYLWLYGDTEVTGDFIWDRNAYIVMNGKSLKIGGDFRPASEMSTVRIQSGLSYDYVEVGGDFVYRYAGIDGIVAGKLVIGGDVTISDTGTETQYNDNHNSGEIILNGTKKQTVTLPQGNKNVRFARLRIENTSKEGVYCEDVMDVEQLFVGDNILHYGDKRVFADTVLTQDMELTENAMVAGGIWDLNGFNVNAGGSLDIISGSLNLNGGTMSVSGNCTVSGEGSFAMQQESEYFKVYGDFEITTVESLEGKLTDGTLEIGGNFTQKDANNFIASGKHKTILRRNPEDAGGEEGENAGTGNTAKQTIYIQRPYPTRFQYLIVKNPPEQYYEWNVPLNVMAKYVIYQQEGDTEPPEKVTRVASYSRTSTTVTLIWDASSDNVGVMGYNIYRDGALIAKGEPDLMYQDKGLKDGVSYSYVVTAVDYAENESEPSEPAVIQNRWPKIAEIYPQDGSVIGGTRALLRLKLNQGTSNRGTIQAEYYSEEQSAWAFMFQQNYSYNSEWMEYNWSLPQITGIQETKIRFTITDEDGNELQQTVAYTIDREAPKEVGELRAAPGEGKVCLAWEKSESSDCQGYYIYRRIQGEKQYKKLATLTDGETETYEDGTVVLNQVYEYKVCSYDNYGNCNTDTTPAEVLVTSDTEAPVKVEGLKVTARTGSAITVAWNRAEDNYGVISYRIYRNGELIAENVTRNEYKDSGLTFGAVYQYSVTALDGAGNESEQSDGVEATCFLPKITEVEPEDYGIIGGKEAELKIYYSTEGSRFGHQVSIDYRLDGEEEWKPIEGTEQLHGQSSSNGQVFIYNWILPESEEDLYSDVRFTLTDADGNSTERIVSYEIDRTPPFFPEDFKKSESEDVVSFTWRPSNSPDAEGYYIYRKEVTQESFTRIATVEGRMSSWYTDRSVETGKSYEYKISAYDAYEQEGEMGGSVYVTVSEDKKAPQIQSVAPQKRRVNRKVSLTVTAYDNRKVDTVTLYLRAEEEEEWRLLAQENAEEDTVVYEWDTTLEKDGTVYLKAVATDSSGNESEEEFLRSFVIDNTGPAKIVLGECTATSSAVQLTWQDVEEEDFSYFVVEQFLEGKWKKIVTVKDELGCTLTEVTPETEYTYRVVAYDDLGNRGEESEKVTVVTIKDTIAPVITKIQPEESRYSNIIELSMHVRDNVAPAYAKFYYSTDGKNFEELATLENEKTEEKECDFEYEWDISALPEGTVKVRFEAYDAAGLKNALTAEEKEVEASYIVDHTPPDRVRGLAVTGTDGAISLKWNGKAEEDIHHYVIRRSETETGEAKLIAENETGCTYTDNRVNQGQTYFYRVAAVDIAGNYGDWSNIISAEVMPDNILPVLYGISPEEGTELGINSKLSFIAADNAQLQKVVLEYREKGSLQIWKNIGEQTIEGEREVYGAIGFDASGLKENTVYEVRGYAVDRAGNESDPVQREYTFDLTPPKRPVLTAEEGSFRVKLDYAGKTDEDTVLYEVYRKEVGEADYTCIQSGTELNYEDITAETDRIYSYTIRAYDRNGNYSESAPVYSSAGKRDTIAPVAVLPQSIMAVTGLTVRLDGTASTDNVRIVSYEWNFGDGKKGKGARPQHTYTKAGTYTLSLTVKDAAGNKNSVTATVLVLDAGNNGVTTLNVVDENGIGIDGAIVYLKLGNEEDNYIKTATDANGRVDIAAESGVYEVAVYKEGFLPNDSTIRISNYEKLQKNMMLESGEVVVGSVSAHRMELSELIESGVDLSNPENYNVFTFRVELTFAKTPLPVIAVASDSGGGFRAGIYGGNGNYGICTLEVPNRQNMGGIVYTAGEGGDVEPQAFLYLSTTQSVKWLKEMYNVELEVHNMAKSRFSMEQATATLNLPEGLELAAVKSGQTMTTVLGKIEGQHSVKASWIVRGKKNGSYALSASFHGILQPFQEPVDMEFSTTQEIAVEGGQGLHIDIYPESALYVGENYYIQFALRNNSNRVFYNMTTTFGDYVAPANKTEIVVKDKETGAVKDRIVKVSGTDYHCASASKCRQLPVIMGGDKINVGVFSPGEVLYGTYVTMPATDADGDEYYYVLVNQLVEILEGANLGVEVEVHPIPSHMQKFKADGEDNAQGRPGGDGGYGDPVDVTTGAFTQEIKSLSIAGAATVSFEMDYNSLLAQKSGETGYGFSHNYEQFVEDEGAVAKFYINPYTSIDFVNEEFLKKTAYGYALDDKVVLDPDAEYSGDFFPISENMKGWTLHKEPDSSEYTIKTKTGAEYLFDTDGKLAKITDADGKSISLKREGNTLTIKEDISKEKIICTYNAQGLITEVADSHGRTCRLGYKNGNLVSYTDALGKEYHFAYDDAHHMTSVRDARGIVTVTNTYDEEGRVLTQKEAGSKNVSEFSYTETEDKFTTEVVVKVDNKQKKTLTYESNSRGDLTKVRDAGGNVTEWTYDERGNVLNEDRPAEGRMSYEYDDDNNRIAVYDTSGNETHMEYDARGNLTAVISNKGETVIYQYNEKNLLVRKYEASNSCLTEYTYNSHGQMTSEKTAGLGTKEYTYKNGRLKTSTDYNGNVTTFGYDSYGNVRSIKDAKENETFYGYDENGNLVESMDAGGKVTVYTYDDVGNVLTETSKGRKTAYTYDGAGRLKTVTDAVGRITTYIYDNDGNLIQTDYPDGTKETCSYDDCGNLTACTKKDGTTSGYGYDEKEQLVEEEDNGQVTSYKYYPNGRVRTKKTYDGQTFYYTYDTKWNLTLVTDGKRRKTAYEYDVYGNVTKITDALGNHVEYVYDDNQRLKSETDKNGNTTKYEYDGNGNRTKITNAEGTVTEMKYDATDCLTEATTHTKDGDVTTRYTYDKMGRVLTVTDAEGNTTRVTYDENGNAVESYDAYGTLVQTNTYDALGRLTSETDILGKVTTYAYNSLGSVESMAEGTEKEIEKRTAYGYTKQGRLVSVTDPLQGVTACTYDERGNMASVTDPMEGVTNYKYDEINRLKEENNAAGIKKEYTYNAEGLLQEKKEAGGTTTYTYDALGQIRTATDALGTVEYKYDKNGNITEVKDKSGTITRTYDKMNRVKTYTDCNGNTVSYGYDELGNRISITYPGGETVRYAYYKTGKLKTVTDAQGGVTYYEYDKNGRLTKAARPDGSTEQYTRGPSGLTTRQTDKTAAGKVIHDYHYGYDIYGNITRITDSGQPDIAYAETVRMEYGKDNRLESYNGEPVDYDARGNMTRGPLNGRMADYTYDCRNRLVKVTEQDGTTTEYEYDAENTRTAEIKNGTKTVYVTDKEASCSQILQETEYKYSRLTGTGKKLSVKTYTYGAGLISEHGNGQDSTRNGVQGSGQGSAQNGAATLYYHYNHLGSTTAVTDKTGNIRYRFAYGTYGELAAVMDGTGATLIRAQTGKTVQECLNEAASETGIRFLYNGKYGVTTEQNGLYYMRARYYNTDIKRFINRDVVDGNIGNSQSLNKYSYVQGNPVNLTDPFGLSPVGGDDDDSGGDDDDDIGGWLGSLWDKLDPDIKHLIKSMIPGYGAYMQFAEAEEYRERGDYFNAVRSATGALANVALTAAVIAALGIAAPAMMVVVLVTSAVVYCSDVATSCYNYGTKVSKGISELMETGGISPATMEEVREAETQAKISLFFGILGAGAIDSCLAKMTTAKGVAGSAGRNKIDFYVKPSGEAVPATGYRYMSSNNAKGALLKGEQYTTYIGFEKYESALSARESFQVSINWNDCKIRGEFDTLQVIDDMYIPTTLGNTTNIPEPFAVSYPQFGAGGAQQFRVDKIVKFINVVMMGD